jgi:integrase
VKAKVTSSEAKIAPASSSHRPEGYQKVLDGRKQPIRGLWIRNGNYYARIAVTDPGTGQKEVRRIRMEEVQTEAQARAELRRLMTKRENQTLPALRRAPTFESYVETYFQYLAQVKDAKRPATVQKERTILRLWSEHMGKTRLNHINRAMINAFIAKRQGAGMSARTVNLDVIGLRNLLKKAIDDGWIKQLPTENLRPLKGTTKKRGLITATDIEKVCAAAVSILDDGKAVSKNGRELADYLKVMAYAGSRRNETLRLKWSDVDWERKQITIGSDGLAKNHEHRVVDFNPTLEALLTEMKGRRAPDSQYLFPSPQRGAKDIPTRTFMESLKAARKAAGITLQFHDCRHFFISMAVMSGIDFMTIARWVGHKDGGVLIGKVYGHLSNEHAQLQATRLVFSPALHSIHG